MDEVYYAIPRNVYSYDPRLGSMFSSLVHKVTGMKLSTLVSAAAPLASFIPVVGPIAAPFAMALTSKASSGGSFDVSSLIRQYFPNGVGGLDIAALIQKLIPGAAGQQIAQGAAAFVRTGYTTQQLSFTQPDGRIVQIYNVRPGSAEEGQVKSLNSAYQSLLTQATSVFATARGMGIALPQEAQAMRESPQANRLPTTLVEQAQYRNARLQWRVDWTLARIGVRSMPRRSLATGGGGGSLGLLAIAAVAAMALA